MYDLLTNVAMEMQFRRLVYSHAWNLLDNNQEQLNLKRSEKFKSAEHTLSVLSKKQVTGPAPPPPLWMDL